MPSLTDVAPPDLLAEEVDIRGTLVKIRGLSGDEWTRIYTRFPRMAAVLAGQPVAEGSLKIDDLRFQAAIVAAAVGAIGDPKMEAVALANLAEEDIRSLVESVFRISHPGHAFGPLLNGAVPPSPAPATEAPATK